MVLICISLMAKDMEYLFTYLLAFSYVFGEMPVQVLCPWIQCLSFTVHSSRRGLERVPSQETLTNLTASLLVAVELAHWPQSFTVSSAAHSFVSRW